MIKNFSKWGGWAAFGITTIGAGLVYFLTAAAGLTWQLGGDDGGDLATAVVVMGIPHPTGYPLYLLLSRIFLPISADPARALNLGSAFWGALGAGLVGLASFKFNLIFIEKGEVESSIFNTGKGAFIWGESKKRISVFSDETEKAAHSLTTSARWKKTVAAGGGILAGLSLAFAPIVWSQAVITEVYSFGLALTGATLYAAARCSGSNGYNRFNLGLFGLSAGLALGHHRTAVFVIAGSLVLLWAVYRQENTVGSGSNSPKKEPLIKKNLIFWKGQGLALFMVGLFLPQLYLLVRGGKEVASNWSDPGLHNLSGLWQHLSGSQYQPLLFAAPLNQSLARVGASINILVQQFGLGGLLFGWVGFVFTFLIIPARPLFWSALTGIGLSTGFASVYFAQNSEVYLIPVFTFWSLLAGWGFNLAASFVINRLIVNKQLGSPYKGRSIYPVSRSTPGFWPDFFRRLNLPGISLVVLIGAGLAVPAISLATNYRRMDLSGMDEAERWGYAALTNAPANAIFASYSDASSFALWYSQYVKHVRPDISVIELRLLPREWYRRNLIRVYPALKLEGMETASLDFPMEQLSKLLAAENPDRPVIPVKPPPEPGVRN